MHIYNAPISCFGNICWITLRAHQVQVESFFSGFDVHPFGMHTKSARTLICIYVCWFLFLPFFAPCATALSCVFIFACTTVCVCVWQQNTCYMWNWFSLFAYKRKDLYMTARRCLRRCSCIRNQYELPHWLCCDGRSQEAIVYITAFALIFFLPALSISLAISFSLAVVRPPSALIFIETITTVASNYHVQFNDI